MLGKHSVDAQSPADRRRMRVCMVNPSGSAFGYVHELCQGLAREGCSIDLYTGPHWRQAARDIRANYGVYLCFYRRSGGRSRVRGLAGRLWRLARLFEHVMGMSNLMIAARRYDVIHVQWLPVPVLDVIAIWVISRFRPVVYTVHNLYPHDARKRYLLKSVLRLIYSIPRVLIVHSQYTSNGLLTEFAVKPGRICRIRHGNFDYLHQLRAGVPDYLPDLHGGSNVLFFGNISEYKGLDVLLKAMARVVLELPSAKLLVAGTPRVKMAPYRRLIQELGLSSSVVLRLGYVGESELGAVFGSASVVVLPYRCVDQSGVAITACTFGKAVVATDVGGLRELLQEAENGILVPAGDEVALGEAILRILRDDRLRGEFERNARRHSETALSWDRIARRTLSVYESLLGGHGWEKGTSD